MLHCSQSPYTPKRFSILSGWVSRPYGPGDGNNAPRFLPFLLGQGPAGVSMYVGVKNIPPL